VHLYSSEIKETTHAKRPLRSHTRELQKLRCVIVYNEPFLVILPLFSDNSSTGQLCRQ
jgi:hypothetical protein